MFERYVNFEFYKTKPTELSEISGFERYVNFEFYKTMLLSIAENDSLRDM